MVHSHVSHIKTIHARWTMEKLQCREGNISFTATEYNLSASGVALIGENSGNLF